MITVCKTDGCYCVPIKYQNLIWHYLKEKWLTKISVSILLMNEIILIVLIQAYIEL